LKDYNILNSKLASFPEGDTLIPFNILYEISPDKRGLFDGSSLIRGGLDYLIIRIFEMHFKEIYEHSNKRSVPH